MKEMKNCDLLYLQQQISILNNAVFNIGFNTANPNALIKVGSELRALELLRTEEGLPTTSIAPSGITLQNGGNTVEMNEKGFIFKNINLLETMYFYFLIIQQEIDIAFLNLLFTTPVDATLNRSLSEISTDGINTTILYFSIYIPQITTFCSTNNFTFSLNSELPYDIVPLLSPDQKIDINFNIIITFENISSLLQYEYFSYSPMVYGNTGSCNGQFYNNWFNISFNSFQLMANLQNTSKKILLVYTLSTEIYEKLNYYNDDKVFIYVFYLSKTYLSSYNIWLRLFQNGTIFSKIFQKVNYIPDFLMSTYLKKIFNIDMQFIINTPVTDTEIKRIIGENLFNAQNTTTVNQSYEGIVNNYVSNNYVNNIIYGNFSTRNNNVPPNGVWTQINVFDLYFDIPDELYNNSQDILINTISDYLVITCFNPQYFGLNYGNIIVYNNSTNLQPLFTIQTSTDLPSLSDPNYPSITPLQPPPGPSGIGNYTVTISADKIISFSPEPQYNIIQTYQIDINEFITAFPDVQQIVVVERQSYPSCVLNNNYYSPQTLSYYSKDDGQLQNYYGGDSAPSSYGNQQVYCPISMRVLTL